MRQYINQTKFPHLWPLFQYALGGTVDKKRLVLATYRGERQMLIEPRQTLTGDPPLVRWYANTLKQGGHLRSVTSLEGLVRHAPDIEVRSTHVAPVGATPFSWPLCANFIVMEACREGDRP